MRKKGGLIIFLWFFFLSAFIWVAQLQAKNANTYSGFPINLNLKDADIRTVLRLIAEETKLNIILADDVRGTIDVHMVDVPWDQALDVILKSKELVKRRVGNVIYVYTLEGYRRELELNKLSRDEERDRFKLKKEKEKEELDSIKRAMELELKQKAAREQSKPLMTVSIPIHYAEAEELKKNFEKHLSKDEKGQPRGFIQVNRFSNSLLIRDVKDVIEEITRLVKKMDRPVPQVLIEGRIVQIQSRYVKDLGIQWGATYQWSRKAGNIPSNRLGGAAAWAQGSGTGIAAAQPAAVAGDVGGIRNFLVNLPAVLSGFGGAIGLTIGTLADKLLLDFQLSALEEEQKARILSKPKILALDNDQAVIESGEEVPFQVFREFGATPEIQFKEAVLKLTVTPHVISDDRVSLKIHITNDRFDFSRPVQGFPTVIKQEAQTSALLKNGQTAVLGGLIVEDVHGGTTGVPGLSRIPVLGWLFKKKDRGEAKQELLIFITPTIIREGQRPRR